MQKILKNIAFLPRKIYNVGMNFDIRSGEYLFKHATDEVPQIDAAHHPSHRHHSFELYYFISGEGTSFRPELF